jgi:hypothetical protein
MDNSDQISKKIKEGFERIESNAPDGIWSAINKNLDDQFDPIDEKVKSGFEQINQAAPKGIWEGIEKQLTIDKGWKKVYKYLRLQTFFKWARRTAAFLLLLIFVAIGFQYSLNKNEKLKENYAELSQKEKENKTLEKGEDAPKITSAKENTSTDTKSKDISVVNLHHKVDAKHQHTEYSSSTTEKSIIPDVQFPKTLSTVNKHESVFMHTPVSAVAEHSNQNIVNQRVSMNGYIDDFVLDNNLNDKRNTTTTAALNDSLAGHANKLDSLLITNAIADLTPATSKQQDHNYPSEEDEKIAIKQPKFELGITTALNFTTVLNNTTRNSFDETSLVTFVPSFGTNLGVQFIYHLSEKHSLVGNLSHLTVNQAYRIFSNGQLNEEEINLGFICFQPLYQYSYKRLETQRTALNIKAGPLLGVATKRKMSINDMTQSITYTNFDFGLTLQLGQSMSFQKLVIDYGLNFDSGLKNLNKGMNNLPASFDKTTHIDLGAYVSFRYTF